ncbi:MAG: response regulator transcription factor [Chitinophagaceae bacterium]|nr:response regulator transcription factor [Chitinophagaceae bacterium]
MMDNGASGYILKNATQQELNEAIHQVASGKTYLGFEVAKTLQAAQQKGQNEIVLGKREKEVLNYIKDGFTNGEICQKMGISINTVDTYRKSLLATLNARNTAELIKVAVVRG